METVLTWGHLQDLRGGICRFNVGGYAGLMWEDLQDLHEAPIYPFDY